MAWARRRTTDAGEERFTGYYRDPTGRTRSAGRYPSRRAALRAAGRREHQVADGSWLDASLGTVTFRDYVEQVWLPSRHIEASTFAAYRSNLDRHFLPAFGNRPMARILPSTIQDWVTSAVAAGLSPRSVRKYHVMLRSIFQRAVRDRIIAFNPCDDTELPKVIARRSRTLRPMSSTGCCPRFQIGTD